MPKKLVNEFAWSVSRARLFQTCPRAYYYHYYGSWGGWEDDASPRTRKLYILKNINSLDMWAGSVIHGCIAEALQRYTRTGEPIKAGKLQSEARKQLRQGWVEAVNQEWLKHPKKNNLHELYYGNGKSLPKAQTERIRKRVNTCLEAFTETEPLKQALTVSFLDWKPIDQLDTFFLDNHLKVWCAIDFAFVRPDGMLSIIDWKTGVEKAEELRLQLVCYGLYAEQKWYTPAEKQRLSAVFLGDNARESVYPLEAETLYSTKEQILSSAARMREQLIDVENNTAQESDFPTCDNPRICERCNFIEVCPFMQQQEETF